MASDLAVEATSLEKSYGPVKVLAGVDLQVERGSVFALLGPNGAGKTTTVRILSTLVRATPARQGWPASTTSATAVGSGAVSASPASTRPSTSSRPARRTCT
jgi:ABC-type branched-subunit amino acid transport system ATPase component